MPCEEDCIHDDYLWISIYEGEPDDVILSMIGIHLLLGCDNYTIFYRKSFNKKVENLKDDIRGALTTYNNF